MLVDIGLNPTPYCTNRTNLIGAVTRMGVSFEEVECNGSWLLRVVQINLQPPMLVEDGLNYDCCVSGTSLNGAMTWMGGILSAVSDGGQLVRAVQVNLIPLFSKVC